MGEHASNVLPRGGGGVEITIGRSPLSGGRMSGTSRFIPKIFLEL